MTDDREPTFGLRPPVHVEALPEDDPLVVAQIQRIARLSTPVRELGPDGTFRGWINPDRVRSGDPERRAS